MISFFQYDGPGDAGDAGKEALDWANFDPASMVLPAHTVRIL